MLKRLLRFWRLHKQKKRFFLISFAVLIFVRLALSTIRYSQLSRLIPDATISPPHDLLDVIGWSVPRAATFVFGASCLTQAVTAQLILARKGYRTEIRIGARRDIQGRFQAHAWLLSNGHVVLGGSQAEIGSYATFGKFSASPQ